MTYEEEKGGPGGWAVCAAADEIIGRQKEQRDAEMNSGK